MSTSATTAAPERSSGAAGLGPQRAKSRELSEGRLASLFISPSVLAMMLVMVFPILYAAYLSLFDYTGRQRQGFAGVANYVQALGNDRFWDAVVATGVFTLGSVGLEFLIGIGFALLMNQAFSGQGVTRATILIPWVIPTVVSAQIWFFMLNITPGFINSVTPLPTDFSWLGRGGWAMASLVLADVWKTAPFVGLLVLAGLQTIPGEVNEAARVDGASTWQRFRRITLPLLRPAIFVALLFRTVDALRIYDLPAVMTNASFGTETLSVLVQQFIVSEPNPGYGSALSTIVFAIVLGIGVLFVRLIGKDLVIGETK